MVKQTHASVEKNQAQRPRPLPPTQDREQLDESASPAAALVRGCGAEPDALSPSQVLALQRTVGNQGVQKIMARHVPVAADAGSRHESGRLTVNREETAPPETAPPEKGTVAVTLTKKGVLDFFKSQFEAEFTGKGLTEYFSLTLASFKKSRKAPKGAAIQSSIQACWEQLAAAIKDLTTDTRAFRKDMVLQVPDGKTPEYLRMRVRLSRRTVATSEEAGIEKALEEVDTAYAYGSKKGLRIEKNTYKAYQQLYKAAEAAGLMKEIPELFKIVSDYRSVTEQKGLWKKKCDKLAKSHPDWTEEKIEEEARQWVAKPGGSAHHTGRAVDLYMGWSIGSGNAKEIRKKKSSLYKKYGKYWEWMKKNAPSYGFLPYAKEPWHWEAWMV